MTPEEEQRWDRIADTVRSMLNHESDVIGHRMNWLGSFEGFLFASVGFSWKLPENTPAFVVCILVLAVSFAILFSLFGASSATRRLLLWWHNNKPAEYRSPDVIGFDIKVPSARLYLASWNFIPLFFAAAWLTLIVVRLHFYVHRSLAHCS